MARLSPSSRVLAMVASFSTAMVIFDGSRPFSRAACVRMSQPTFISFGDSQPGIQPSPYFPARLAASFIHPPTHSGGLGRDVHPPANPHRRMWLLYRLRINFGVLEFDEFAFVGSELLRPYRFHRFDVFVSGGAAPLVGHAEHAKLVRLAGRFGTETDTDEQTPIGQVIQRRILFGGVNRISARHDQ